MNSDSLSNLKRNSFSGLTQKRRRASSPCDYIPTLVYQARAHIALNDPTAAASLVPAHSENVALKAVSALARYVASPEPESVLEELRDLAVEIEGKVEGSERDKCAVRVLSGTAFARAGEIYLSINRPDRAKFERAKHWAEDDLFLQLIESSIGLQLANLSSPHILTARGVTRILRNEIPEAKSDLEELLERQKDDAETLAAFVVATGMGKKSDEADELWTRLSTQHSSHPSLVDVAQKTDLFEEFCAKFTVPPLAVSTAA
ncbi:hypothetical protein C8F01DRAFT_1206453 [Mycena amicta]|nr:hypothetical protein C8F01DRAFT_1206453 [Mycena amicta]